MSTIAEELTRTRRPSLSAITDILVRRGNLVDSEETESLCQQLVFIMVGWITMLYEPDPMPAADAVSILLAQGSDLTTMATDTMRTTSLPLEEVSEIPYHQVLKSFGSLIPGWTANSSPKSAILDLYSERLIVNYLNYHILSKVALVTVEFVSSVSLHLEFDEQSRKLKLFRFPSFCRLINSGVLSTTVDDSPEMSGRNFLSRHVATSMILLLLYR